MTNFAFPLAAAGVLLVLLSLILLRYFRASNIAARKKRKRATAGDTDASSYTDSNDYFSMRGDGGTCDGNAGSSSCDDSAGSAACATSGGDAGGDFGN